MLGPASCCPANCCPAVRDKHGAFQEEEQNIAVVDFTEQDKHGAFQEEEQNIAVVDFTEQIIKTEISKVWCSPNSPKSKFTWRIPSFDAWAVLNGGFRRVSLFSAAGQVLHGKPIKSLKKKKVVETEVALVVEVVVIVVIGGGGETRLRGPGPHADTITRHYTHPYVNRMN